MDGHEWLTSYRARVSEIGDLAAAAQRALATVEGTATSRDGAVTVTVDPGGALRRLELSERAEHLTRVQLAAAVVDTARRAQDEAARRATAAVAPLIGEQSEAMRVLRRHLPVGEEAR